MSKKIEVKVNMHCEKCRREVLKAVTKLEGIDQVSVDLEKQMLVVIGDVDPVCVVTYVRKIGKVAEITSVGPPKKPDPPPVPNPPPVPDPCPIYTYPTCNDFHCATAVGYPQPCDGGGCFIL